MDTDEFERRIAAGRSRLLQRVAARQRARRTMTATAVLLIAGTGAAALLGAQSANGQATAAGVTCYSQAHLSAPHIAAYQAATPGTAGAHLTSTSGAALCAKFWSEKGVVVAAGSRGGALSSLEAALCRLADGSVAVFPHPRTTTNERLCDELGLTVVA
jgi:hypothetical protein